LEFKKKTQLDFDEPIYGSCSDGRYDLVLSKVTWKRRDRCELVLSPSLTMNTKYPGKTADLQVNFNSIDRIAKSGPLNLIFLKLHEFLLALQPLGGNYTGCPIGKRGQTGSSGHDKLYSFTAEKSLL
jgi:hypothetical protein